MAVTAKVLARTAASLTTTTVLYTVPTTTTSTVVTNIAVTNTAASAGTFTLAIDGVALHTTTAIAANTTVYIDCKQVIPANATPKTITGGASAITINFHVSGVEIV
jgi:uncharacterized metal-binding protein